MTTYIDLKDCPFCGTEARMQDYTQPPFTEDHGASAECPNCWAYFYGDTPEEAAKKWNKRADTK